MDALPDHALLTRKQVSEMSGFADITLRLWSTQGKGPTITRIEGRPRYMVRDVRQWLRLPEGTPITTGFQGPGGARKIAPATRKQALSEAAQAKAAADLLWEQGAPSDYLPDPNRVKRATLSLKTLRTAGVYFLLVGDKPVYIGQAVSLLPRITSHLPYYNDITNVLTLKCPLDELDDLEGFYIRFFRPQRNGNDGPITGLTSHNAQENQRRAIAMRNDFARWRVIPAVS
jgi:hypothetical protein